MCAGAHPASEHQCGVDGCKIGKGKLCVHVKVQCANCQGNHQANSTRCPARQKVETQARQKKIVKNPESATKVIAAVESNEEERDPQENGQEMDEAEEWAKGTTPEFSFDISDESRDHIPDYT